MILILNFFNEKKMMEFFKRNIVYFVIISCLFVTSGCVQRKLTVKSDPPQAQVYFDGQYIGETPVDFDFEWYWEHSVELKKEGYETISTSEEIKAPVYMWIPFDLAMELLPFTVRDERELTYTLKPREVSVEEDDQEVVIEKIDLSN
jgi:hypothetical protein